MATETAPSESTMNKSIEEAMEDLHIEKPPQATEVSPTVETTSYPELEEKKTLKKEMSPEVTENETLKEKEAPEPTMEEAVKEQEAPEITESEVLKEPVSPDITEKGTLKEQEIPEAIENVLKEQEAPEVPQKGTFKEQEISEATENALKEQEIPEGTKREALKEEETLEGAEKETMVEQETPKDKAPPDTPVENVAKVVEEEKSMKELSESAEADREKEVNNSDTREVVVPTVEQRSRAGDESRTEDVPTTVVHEAKDGVKPSPRRDIFHNIGSKMMQSMQKMKNAITGKSSK